MANNNTFRENILEVSADLVRDCPGLSMDVGGSVAKLVYRSKQDWQELVNNKDAKTGKLRLLSCARTELDAAIDKVKAEAYITPGKDGKPTEIFTCGIGCHQYGPRINRLLNVKLANVLEMDCFIKSFLYLVDRYSFKTLILPPCQNVIDDHEEEMKKMESLVENFKSFTNMTLDTEDTETQEQKQDPYESDLPISELLGEDMYPCMMSMLGSAFGFMTIQRDGSFAFPDGSIRGGRTMLGLGALLFGAKSYDEIIDLAEKGDAFKLTTSQKYFQVEKISNEAEDEEEDQGANVYGQMFGSDDENMTDFPIFIFGNAVGKTIADFKKEDIAAALVAMSINDTVQAIFTTCLRVGVKRVFVAGSYTNRKFMREQFTMEWLQRRDQMKMMGGDKCELALHFMGQGSHLGALGALINNVEKFIGRDGIVKAANGDVKQPKSDVAESASYVTESASDVKESEGSQAIDSKNCNVTDQPN